MLTRFGGLCCVVLAALFASSQVTDPQTVLSWRGHRMFEDFSARSEVSPDGRWVLRTFVDGNQSLLKLPDGTEDMVTLKGEVKDFERAAWCGNQLLRLGSDGKKRGWFLRRGFLSSRVAVPAEATPVCSNDGAHLAHFTSFPARRELPPPKSVYIGNSSAQREVKVDGVVLSARFSPDAGYIYVLVRQKSGAASLIAISVSKLSLSLLARDLDVWPFPGPQLAVTPDGSGIILPLATLQPPDDARRQVPHAPERWLKLYRFDLNRHRFTLLARNDDWDQTDPAVVNGRELYWVSGRTTKSVVALPAAGGEVRPVITGKEAYLPSWSRDGKRLAFVVGDYRLADWALNQDVAIVPADAQVHPARPETMFVVGNHEDFPVEWSPDGQWIAWHSHRDPTRNAPYYDAPGATDDIWLRRADDLSAPEIRLTRNLWETGWAYWSPDGRQLIYTTWDRNGQAGIYEVRVMSLDPHTGKSLEERRFPMPKAVHSPEVAIWSPSGNEIAVEDAVNPSERILWVVSRDGTRLENVVRYRSETYGGLDWAPDGKTLFYSGMEGDRMQIFAVPRHGGPSQQLSHGTGNYLNPRVSPDGRWIACSQIETIQTLLRMPLP